MKFRLYDDSDMAEDLLEGSKLGDDEYKKELKKIKISQIPIY